MSVVTRRPAENVPPTIALPRTQTVGNTFTERLLRPFLVSASSGENFAYLDGIRAVALLTVMIFHCWYLSGQPQIALPLPFGAGMLDFTPLFLAGGYGVNLFFVLSGFLLSQSWIKADYAGRPRPSILRYARLRFFRIVPAYYCCLFLMILFLCPAFIAPETVYSAFGIRVVGSYLLFLQYYSPTTAGSLPINGALWTLSIEMLFYLTLPLVIPLFLRNRWLIALPLTIAASVTWAYLCQNALGGFIHAVTGSAPTPGIRFFMHQQYPGHFAEFGFGIALANLAVRRKMGLGMGRVFRAATREGAAAVYFAVGVALVLFCMKKVSEPGLVMSVYLRDVAVALGYTLMIAGVLWGGMRFQRIFSAVPLQFIGLISYSMYLWHFPIIYIQNRFPQVAALPPFERFERVTLFALVATTLLSICSYLAVEKPFLRMGRRAAAAPSIPPATDLAADHATP